MKNFKEQICKVCGKKIKFFCPDNKGFCFDCGLAKDELSTINKRVNNIILARYKYAPYLYVV